MTKVTCLLFKIIHYNVFFNQNRIVQGGGYLLSDPFPLDMRDLRFPEGFQVVIKVLSFLVRPLSNMAQGLVKRYEG